MFIKSLTILSENTVIREITFHDGINLIIDETKSITGTETGNNVGKTTVLKLIDFCLCGDAKDIYTDTENRKSEYKFVKDFLTNNKVVIRLILKENLAIKNSEEICIERNFLSYSKKIQKINGISYEDSDFEKFLTDTLFPGHYPKKPSFRQIISHNIRIKEINLTNTLKTLNQFTRDEEYETLYLFLLGCDFEQGNVKQNLLQQIRQETNFKERLEKVKTKSTYETILSILNRDIEGLQQKKSKLNINEHLLADIELLNNVKYQISSLSDEICKLNIRRDLINESKVQLDRDKSNIDIDQLKMIYEQATTYVNNVQKTFEELNSFHNKMIKEKVIFVTKELPFLENQITQKNESLSQLLIQQKEISEKISYSDSFSDLENVITELNEKYQQKGEYENIISQISLTEENLKKYSSELSEIDDKLFSTSFSLTLRQQVDKFNKFFTEISQLLYEEQYALTFDPIEKNGQRIYKFNSFNMNFSSGKKQGEISCFDIAYTKFADSEDISCFHFLLTDKKELVHNNQLSKIAKYVNINGIQFVCSILKDKIPGELNSDKYIIVRLSQENKLFRIESNS